MPTSSRPMKMTQIPPVSDPRIICLSAAPPAAAFTPPPITAWDRPLASWMTDRGNPQRQRAGQEPDHQTRRDLLDRVAGLDGLVAHHDHARR